MADLNYRQHRFALEYCVDGNATQAAIRAGYSRSGAGQQGDKLLKNHQIQALIAEERRRLEYRTGVTAERVRLEFARVAFSDLRDFAKWGGAQHGVKWAASKELTDDAAACIQEITETIRELEDGGTSSTKKFRLYDKLSALKELAKLMGLYPANQTGGINVNVNVDNRQERPDYSKLTLEEQREYVAYLRKLRGESSDEPTRIGSGAFPSRN